jgi:hypothetical protein
MSEFRNPITTQSRPRSAGMYFARITRKIRVVIQNLTPWSAGLAVTSGDYVQNVGNCYQALNTGTTGVTAPTQLQGKSSDGTITWQFTDPQSMRQFITTNGAPTPT